MKSVRRSRRGLPRHGCAKHCPDRYPYRPIRIIQGFGGGVSDTLAHRLRQAGERLAS
jgi:hypothetical protein